jgi:hypothetical protein
MNISLLRQLTNDQYFIQGTVYLKSRGFLYNKGHIGDTNLLRTKLTQKKVLVPVKPKDMQDLGFGQYGSAENFWLYTFNNLKFQNGTLFQKSDIVEYKSKDFQILSQLDFETHGFYGQLITSLLEGTLND